METESFGALCRSRAQESGFEAERTKTPVLVSIGILAWNEEKGISSTLHSLFEQSLFAELERRGSSCEILCMINGCTDRTPEIAEQIFAQQAAQHPQRNSFTGRVENLKEQGKQNAWNEFVHRRSATESQFLIVMDADISIHRKETLWNLIVALQKDPQLSVAATLPCKDIAFKSRTAIKERLSLSMSQMTQAAQGQLCAQLYCIRAPIARNLYLPRDLGACEDGFIKAVACTDFFTHEIMPRRVQIVSQAEHTFEAYTSPVAVLRNQKRQIIGQTILHVLLDKHLKYLSVRERQELGETLKRKEEADRFWIKGLIAEHLKQTRHFWLLYPGLLTVRWKRLKNLSRWKQVTCFPAAAASVAVAFIASFMAWKALKIGGTGYWPGKSENRPARLREPRAANSLSGVMLPGEVSKS